MEFMQLEMFLAVVEERSVNRAAERVCRTQPAVSIAMRKLEEEFGVALFDRPRRGTYRLTQAGELLYDLAAQMVTLRNEAISALRGPTLAMPVHYLALGVAGAESARRVALQLETFRKRNLGIRVEISIDSLNRLLRDLADHNVDLLLLEKLPSRRDLSPHLIAIPTELGNGGPLWVVHPRLSLSGPAKKLVEMISSLPGTAPQLSRGRRTKYRESGLAGSKVA